MRLGISFPPLTQDVVLADGGVGQPETMGSVTGKTVSTIAQIFQSKERKQLHGVVGSYTVTEKSFSPAPARLCGCSP